MTGCARNMMDRAKYRLHPTVTTEPELWKGVNDRMKELFVDASKREECIKIRVVARERVNRTESWEEWGMVGNGQVGIETGEAWTIREGLVLANRKKWTHIRIHSDAKN